MDRFVCVRLVRAETLDLSLFQFDSDLSFAVFFMNAEGNIYGRYGTRSSFSNAEREISLEGLRKAMKTALSWHSKMPDIRSSLAAKRGPAPKYRSFDDFPTAEINRRFGRAGRGNRGGRCTHCHDLRTSEQLSFRLEGKPIPERSLFAWPLPDVVGLSLDPKEMATVNKVYDGMPASKSRLQVGDEIVRIEGQPILSIADVQWVLHNADDEDILTAEIRRNGELLTAKIELKVGWRRFVDISWRSTTRALRQRVTGGVEFRDLSADERATHGLARNVVALQASFVPFYSTGPIRDRDIVIEVDESAKYMSEGDLIAYCLQKKNSGDELSLRIVRGTERLDVKIRVD